MYRPNNTVIMQSLILCALIILTPADYMVSQPLPHVESTRNFRITNRKYISHTLIQNIAGENVITILTVHPLHNAFHADSHFLHYKCGTPTSCLKKLKELDSYLRTGSNLRLELEGSSIKKIIYLDNSVLAEPVM